MDDVSLVCLVSIIGVGIFVNILAIVFLVHKSSLKTMKDKVVLMLCVMNSLQSVGFGMELSAVIEGTCEFL